MEKKEARIKCSGCGASFKVKVPVTDKPVSFKCKKCGKVLKLKLKSAVQPPAEPQAPDPLTAGFEPTQLFDSSGYYRELSESQTKQPSVVEHLFLDTPAEAPTGFPDKGRRWIVLAGDVIRGPFSDPDIVKMIETGEVTADMSLRMGERPWIKASDVADFREFFAASPARHLAGFTPDSRRRATGEGGEDQEEQVGPPFHEHLSALFAYPMSGNQGLPLIIFTVIAFLLSSILSWDFLIGLPVNLLGWTVLYGYLYQLMRTSMKTPEGPPPPWNFSGIQELLSRGIQVLVLLLLFCLIPVSLCLILMIAFFLNAMVLLGYVFMGMTVAVYAVSLLAVPAGLMALASSGKLGAALNPVKAIKLMKNGGKAYWMLTAISVGVGLVCMIAAFSGVFLVEIPVAGFVVAGLVMALLLSYGHFVWFHVMGRFSSENPALMKQVVSA